MSIVLNLCIKVCDNNSNEYAFMDTFIGMIIKFAKKNKLFRQTLYQHTLVDKMNKWLSNNPTPPLQSYRTQTTVFKTGKHNHKFSYDVINNEIADIKEFNTKRRNDLKTMYKKPESEDPEPESEDDLYEVDLEAGTKVDYLLSTYKWVSGTILVSLGEFIKVQKDDDQMDVDGQATLPQQQWISKDETDLAPYKAKTGSMKANTLGIYTKAYYA